MKIQEALTKVRELKADAQALFNEASSEKVRTLYLDVAAEYYTEKKDYFTGEKISQAVLKLKEAHELKLAVQQANVDNSLSDLIQELDFLKSVCSAIKEFVNIPERTDPQIMHTGGLRAQMTYKVEETTFHTEYINTAYREAQERIRKINEELQQKNWEVEVDAAEIPLSISL